jgi:hypothetical protein
LLAILARALHWVMACAASEGCGLEEGIMKGQPSFATLIDCRCPICGTIKAKMTSAGRNSSFACSRCNTELELTAWAPRVIFSASILLSLTLSVAMGLRGLNFTLALVGITVAFNWLGQLMEKIVAVPKLRVRPNAEGLNSPKHVLPAHLPDRSSRQTFDSESIRCQLVTMHD